MTTPAYLQRHPDGTGLGSQGVRARVGAPHLPLASLLGAISNAGLVIDTVTEVGSPTPDILAVGAHKPVH